MKDWCLSHPFMTFFITLASIDAMVRIILYLMWLISYLAGLGTHQGGIHV